MNQLRNLNFVERLEWEIGNGVPFNAVIEVTVPSKIIKSSLKHILSLIQKKHPLLSVRIIHSTDGYEFQTINQTIPLIYKTFTQPRIEEWQKKKLFKISLSSTLWEIANQISKNLEEKIESGAHFDTLANLYEWLRQNPSSESVKAMARVNGPVFSVSNLGQVELPNLLHSHLVPKELMALVTVHNLYPHENTLMAVAMTYHQSLHITLLGTQPSVNKAFLSDFSSKFKTLILNAIR